MNRDTWFRVLAAGANNGAITRTAREARESWERMMIRRYGRPCLGTAYDAHSAILASAPTRRAMQAADISDLGNAVIVAEADEDDESLLAMETA